MAILIIKTIFIYIFITLALRIMGKRQLGELQPAELVITILISNIATLSLEDINIPLLNSIIPIFTLVFCEVVVSVAVLKNNGLRKIISGNPCIIIRDGNIDQSELKDLRWSIDDLMEQLRAKGYFTIADIDLAIVETSGMLSVFPKFASRPVSAAMLNLPVKNQLDSPPQIIISDGTLVKDALRYCGVTENWLTKLLQKEGCPQNQVFLLLCDRKLNYTLVRKEYQ